MKKILVTLILTLAAGTALLAQSTSAVHVYKSDTDLGYYVKDGVTYQVYIGREPYEVGSRWLLVPDQNGHSHKIFSPKEVSAYGLANGKKHFISAAIETAAGSESFFLEELQRFDDGSSILYLSGAVLPTDSYFLLKDGVVTPLATRKKPAQMWELLSSLNDCTEKWDLPVRYPSRLKKRMVRQYHEAFAWCNEKMFPKNRFGIAASFGGSRPRVADRRIAGLDYGGRKDYHFSFSAGVFARIPLEEVLSFQPEVHYFRQVMSDPAKIEYTYGTAVYTPASGFENNAIHLPMMFRFTNNFARKNLMPYAEMGPLFDINFGKFWYGEDYEQFGIEPKRKLPVFTAGLAVGVGAEYYINARHAASLGVRMNYVNNMNRSNRYDLLTFEIVAAFSLFNF